MPFLFIKETINLKNQYYSLTIMNHLPNRIFELAQQKSFNALTETEVKEVLTYIRKTDYNDLHEGAKLGRLLEYKSPQANSQYTKKLELIKKLKAQPSNQNLLDYPIALWKVAASLLLILLIGGIYLRSNLIPKQTIYVASIDTLYIDKPALIDTIIERVIFHDTLFKDKIIMNDESMSYKKAIAIKSNEPYLLETGSIQQLKVTALGSELNSKKGKNIKDDTLINKIGFTTL